MEELRFLSKYLALGVLVFGLIRYNKYSNTKAKFFIYSIVYAVLTEFTGANFHDLFEMPNYPVYNTFTIVQLTFFLWWFKSLIESKRRKKIITICIAIFLTFAVFNTIFGQNFFEAGQTYTYAVGVICMLLSICLYFIESFNKETILNITDSIYFWFSLGLLLFYGTFMPFMFASRLFLNTNSVIFSTVLFFLNAIMYGCFAIGFYKADGNDNEHVL